MNVRRLQLPRGRFAAFALASALAVLASPAMAELAIFTDGDFLKVEGYQLLDGDRMRLLLPGGGSVTLTLDRLERVIDDEIEPAVPAPPAPVPIEPVFELAFHPSQTAPVTPYGDLLYRTARRHALNPALLAAVARAESAFDPQALSRKGARGLLQLMPATAERFGIQSSRLWDPESNVEAGARYLRFLTDEFRGDLRLVLAAYNAGEGAVRRHGGVPPYRETQRYVRRILTELGVLPAGERVPVSAGG